LSGGSAFPSLSKVSSESVTLGVVKRVKASAVKRVKASVVKRVKSEGGSGEEHEVERGVEEEQNLEGAADVVGEEKPEVLRQYQREFEDDELALEEGSSDDEDDEYDGNVPMDWQNYDFSQLIINAGENASREYKENEVSVGAMYPTFEHLKDAVKRWATLTTQREFKVMKSSTRVYNVCCVKPDCAF
jgi:hypothetical protein